MSATLARGNILCHDPCKSKARSLAPIMVARFRFCRENSSIAANLKKHKISQELQYNLQYDSHWSQWGPWLFAGLDWPPEDFPIGDRCGWIEEVGFSFALEFKEAKAVQGLLWLIHIGTLYCDNYLGGLSIFLCNMTVSIKLWTIGEIWDSALSNIVISSRSFGRRGRMFLSYPEVMKIMEADSLLIISGFFSNMNVQFLPLGLFDQLCKTDRFWIEPKSAFITYVYMMNPNA